MYKIGVKKIQFQFQTPKEECKAQLIDSNPKKGKKQNDLTLKKRKIN
jgi:hypothetical protein